MSETRKLVAILVADVVGYSRLAGADEDRTLSRLRGLRSDLIDPAIARIVKRTGDGSIIEFRSVMDTVRCAIEPLGSAPSIRRARRLLISGHGLPHRDQFSISAEWSFSPSVRSLLRESSSTSPITYSPSALSRASHCRADAWAR